MTRAKRTWSVPCLTFLVMAAAVAGLAACRDHAPPADQHSAPAVTPPDPAVGAAPPEAPGSGGMKAYVDPKTGKLTDTAPAGAEPLPGDVLAPSGTVVERPAEGGGQVLDMRGQRKPEADAAP